MQNTIQKFIKENLSYIYDYINTEILQDVGAINYDYYKKVMQELFLDKTDTQINQYHLTTNLIPYFLFVKLQEIARVDYTTLRVETLNFEKLNKEASTYYNYVRFSIKDDFLSIELMQTKIGGMPIDNDIVKFTKNVAIQNNGLEKFIQNMVNS